MPIPPLFRRMRLRASSKVALLRYHLGVNQCWQHGQVVVSYRLSWSISNAVIHLMIKIGPLDINIAKFDFYEVNVPKVLSKFSGTSLMTHM